MNTLHIPEDQEQSAEGVLLAHILNLFEGDGYPCVSCVACVMANTFGKFLEGSGCSQEDGDKIMLEWAIAIAAKAGVTAQFIALPVESSDETVH